MSGMQSNEIVLLVLGLITFSFMLANRPGLLRGERSHLLCFAFSAQLLAWVATNLEGLFWFTAWNTVEHGAEALSAGLLLWWCLRASRLTGGQSP